METKKTYYYEYKSFENVYTGKDGKTRLEKEVYIDDNGKKTHNKTEKVLNNQMSKQMKYRIRKLY